MHTFKFKFPLESLKEGCFEDDKGHECAKFGYQYAQNITYKDSDFNVALGCIKEESYNRACFDYGEIIGDLERNGLIENIK